MLVPRQHFDSKPQPTRGHPARHHALHPSPLETMEHAALHIHIDAHKTTHTHTHTQTRVQIVRETASGEWTNSSKVRLARGVAPRHERFSALIHSCLPAFLPSAQTRQAATPANATTTSAALPHPFFCLAHAAHAQAFTPAHDHGPIRRHSSPSSTAALPALRPQH